MKLRIDLDEETSEALYLSAEPELRHPCRQAEALLRQALGLPFPLPPLPCQETQQADPVPAGAGHE